MIDPYLGAVLVFSLLAIVLIVVSEWEDHRSGLCGCKNRTKLEAERE